MTDIEIARAYSMQNIMEIAKQAGMPTDKVEQYGKYKAKLDLGVCQPTGKLVLVTAINPTSLGEGKTTVAIGLMDGLKRIGKKVVGALREPSLGPVFGIKGGATGGGHAQVVPMEDINLHFNGDLHAITAANNLLAAILDNHIFQGNALKIDISKITWRRCMDMNDRALRNTVVGLGGEKDGIPRMSGFDITAASEIMAILCLASDLTDLKQRLGRIIVGYTVDNRPVTCHELGAEDSLAILLKEAIKPNLVQTLEGTPVIIHGGPFANIAHGCNSIIATKAALSLADYVVTEAGFGADLGAEKFMDVKCRVAGLCPEVVVLVATVKALKLSGGADKLALKERNMAALVRGLANLTKHIENITGIFNRKCVVALNRFSTDSDEELALIANACAEFGVKAFDTTVWLNGGEGAESLAYEVVRLCSEEDKPFTFAYDLESTIEQKIGDIVTRVYGGKNVVFTPQARMEMEQLEKLGFGKLPVIIAKTQYSLSDNPKLLGRPTGFDVTIKQVKVRAGAGFVVAQAGDMMLMPGLPKVPAACGMTIDGVSGEIVGLF